MLCKNPGPGIDYIPQITEDQQTYFFRSRSLAKKFFDSLRIFGTNLLLAIVLPSHTITDAPSLWSSLVEENEQPDRTNSQTCMECWHACTA